MQRPYFDVGEACSRVNFFEKVYEIVRSIPPGHVMSYGQVARLAGNPRMARQVGWALHALSSADGVPWQRVVQKDGRIAGRYEEGGVGLQRALLEAEGVRFDAQGRILQDYRIELGESDRCAGALAARARPGTKKST